MTYVIDTHPLVWFLEANPRLSAAAKSAMSDPTAQIIIPTIALVEIRYLQTAARIKIGLAEVYERFFSSANCSACPLDEEIAGRIPESLNIHDAIITATALVYRDVLGHSVKLITKDKKIHESKLVEVLW